MLRGRDWGIARVYVDGRLHGEVSQYAPNPGELFFAYDVSGLEPGDHAIEVRYEGKKAAKAKKRQINLDAFTVDGHPVPKPGDVPLPGEPPNGGEEDLDEPEAGCFEDASEKWVCDAERDCLVHPVLNRRVGRQRAARPGPAEEANAIFAEFTFSAEGFALLYHKGEYGGQPTSTWTASSANGWTCTRQRPVAENALYEVTGLTPGTHTLRIVTLASRTRCRAAQCSH